MWVSVKSDAFKKFLTAIKGVYNGGVTLTILKNRIEALTTTEDSASIFFYGFIPCITEGITSSEVIHIKEIFKLEKLLEFNGLSEDFKFTLEENHIYYENDSIKGAKFMLGEHADRRCIELIDRAWFKFSNPIFSGQLEPADIGKILQLTSFATDTKKVYFYLEDGCLVADLNDETQVDIDSVKLNLLRNFNGSFNTKIIVLTENLQRLTSISGAPITMEVVEGESSSGKHEVLYFTTRNEGVIYRYLFNVWRQ